MTWLHVVVPGPLDTPTGGFVYDRRVVAGLRAQGRDVRVHELPPGWPAPDADAMAAAEAALAALPDGARVLLDGLALGVLPELAARHAARLRLVGLVHHPLAEETGLDAAARARLRDSERRALAAVRHVVVTSAFTAERLLDYGVDRARLSVVPPGVDPAPLATGSTGPGPRLLCVASLTPRKGHDVLLNALAGLADRVWRLELVGSDTLAVRHAAGLRRLCGRLGLEGRVRFRGELHGAALEQAYDEADLFVLASHYEGYGMVLTEAVARGLPVVATAGGAVADTLPAGSGLLAPPGEVAALRGALGRVLDEPELRERLVAGARAARARLSTWARTAEQLAAELDRAVP